MTLKDFINKGQLTSEEGKQLIVELHKDPEVFLSNYSYDEVSTTIREIIEEEGLKDGDVAYIIGKKYYDLYNLAIEEDNENKEEIYAEKKNYWYIKAFELDSSFIDIECTAWPEIQGSTSFCSLFDLECEVDYFNPSCRTALLRKADSECLNSWGCRYLEQGIECNNKEYLDNACYLFKLSNSNESKISLYHIYVNGLGVKKNLKKANSFIKNLPANTPLYAFKSNISEGIKIEKIEEDNEQEQPKKEKKQRKPRKKNKVKSFFKKILSLFK